MIGPPSGVRIWLACGVTDLRNGFDGLAAIVQTQLSEHPYSGQPFAFRGRRGDRGALDFAAITPGRNTAYFPKIFEPPSVRC
jgi:transposase